MITHKPPVAEVDHERSSCGGEREEPRIPTRFFPGGNIGPHTASLMSCDYALTVILGIQQDTLANVICLVDTVS
ncbi:hypothetical protein IFM58399_01935 [Aspergillus lentulus]|uniref:uncharacterized protein n=1 Tax=Aspergillus lentulus TaxID=293939 RepID=UPI0013930618|nr:uncharacterized protein IFM58399_01935 [Aspergillus lentulus]GFF28292.1 hypothetical protein IFM58399_01935 [Aspergillus lentulus]GFG05649.1 hypothetical protein IFM61392_03942 [Aspergillus lentulus]